jgi:hypothetical protein
MKEGNQMGEEFHQKSAQRRIRMRFVIVGPWVLLIVALNPLVGYTQTGDEERNLVIQNEDAVSTAVALYRADRGRLPVTFQGLADSPLMCVRAQDLTNPYTGQPMNLVSEPTAGDLVWDYSAAEGRLTFTSALRAPPDDSLLALPLEYREEEFAEATNEQPLVEKPGEGSATQHTRACAAYLQELAWAFKQNNGRPANGVAELQGPHPLVLKMWNAFQSRFAQSRALSDPVPGDFHYQTCDDPQTGERISEVTFFLENGETVRDGKCSGNPTW